MKLKTSHNAARERINEMIVSGNILLDKGGRPFVADFGLALREI